MDSTGSATESTTSSAANEESNHAISTVDTTKELDAKELDDSGTTIMNDTSTEDVTKANVSAIDASSTNEDDDSGEYFGYFSTVFR